MTEPNLMIICVRVTNENSNYKNVEQINFGYFSIKQEDMALFKIYVSKLGSKFSITYMNVEPLGEINDKTCVYYIVDTANYVNGDTKYIYCDSKNAYKLCAKRFGDYAFELTRIDIKHVTLAELRERMKELTALETKTKETDNKCLDELKTIDEELKKMAALVNKKKELENNINTNKSDHDKNKNKLLSSFMPCYIDNYLATTKYCNNCNKVVSVLDEHIENSSYTCLRE